MLTVLLDLNATWKLWVCIQAVVRAGCFERARMFIWNVSNER